MFEKFRKSMSKDKESQAKESLKDQVEETLDQAIEDVENWDDDKVKQIMKDNYNFGIPIKHMSNLFKEKQISQNASCIGKWLSGDTKISINSRKIANLIIQENMDKIQDKLWKYDSKKVDVIDEYYGFTLEDSDQLFLLANNVVVHSK